MEDNSQFNISPLYSLGFVTEIFWEPDIGVRNRSQVGQTRVGYSAERIGKFKFFNNQRSPNDCGAERWNTEKSSEWSGAECNLYMWFTFDWSLQRYGTLGVIFFSLSCLLLVKCIWLLKKHNLTYFNNCAPVISIQAMSHELLRSL